MLLIVVFAVVTAAWQSIDTDTVAKNVMVHFPNGQTWYPSQEVTTETPAPAFPVVFFLQGTGGGDRRAESWSEWFTQHGVGSVIISSARMRGQKNLIGVPPVLLAKDVQKAVDVVKRHPQVDLSHYAIMGFSKGGTAALRASSQKNDDTTIAPDFLFALYPAGTGGCIFSFENETDVHVFYGDLDDWGSYKNNRVNCKQIASKHRNAAFHSLQNAHHGYDDSIIFDYQYKGKNFHSEPNAVARERSEQIILEAIRKRWALKELH